MKRWFLRILLLVGVLFLGLVVYGLILDEDRPVPGQSEQGDEHARALQTAVNLPAWDEIQAVRWVFAGRHELLWDKHRGFIRVRWGDNEVIRRVDEAVGVATVDGAAVEGDAKTALLEEAYAHWTNDAFWLNPVPSFFNKDVQRTLARTSNGNTGLYVTYGSGGVTPGDSYLWEVGGDGLPSAWQMWVGILPIGGLRATWEGWITIGGGAQVATRHEIAFLTLELTDIAAGELAEIEPGPDPFAAIAGDRAPASQPSR